MGGPAMNPEKHGRGVEQAWEMLDLFASLEVRAFDLTTTDLDGHKRMFRRAMSLTALRQGIPGMLEAANRSRHNLIVRARRGRFELVQLDDLSGEMVERWRTAAFMILATSAGNHQAWAAVAECVPGLARRLREASGADPSASGAVRVAGSANFKRKYAPQFPIVRLLQGMPQRSMTLAELETLGLIAAPQKTAVDRTIRITSQRRATAWPSYERCLRNAPRARNSDRADVSRADFTFCLLAIDWGWSVAATSQRLSQVSTKAREQGITYVRLTVERAAAAVVRRSMITPQLL